MLIKAGKVVVYPTDTVYGLGANALDSAAVHKIFKVKGRPTGTPIPVAVDGIKMADRLAVINSEAKKLIATFWPGALTLILPKKDIIPEIVTAGHLGLALRAPDHQVPLMIIRKSKLPLIATSANLHGAPNCINAQEAAKQIGNHVDLILDGGPTTDTASTVLDLTSEEPKVLREGPVTRLMLRGILGYHID
jgi:L-threonylcarbamoyladenylate synthase